MASRDRNDLCTKLQPIFDQFFANCKAAGYDVICTCTYRSPDEQNHLYAQGRTIPGGIVTNAKAGQSAHNAVDEDGNPAARAFDVVPLRNGKPVWGTVGADLMLWDAIGKIGEALGLEWYGEPEAKFREFAHFELPKE